jgi:hypothetical protein
VLVPLELVREVVWNVVVLDSLMLLAEVTLLLELVELIVEVLVLD